MSDWQPIETVPKDGSVFIMRRHRKESNRAIPMRWNYHIDPEYPWQGLCEEFGDNFYPDDDYNKEWQPLPEPPKDTPND